MGHHLETSSTTSFSLNIKRVSEAVFTDEHQLFSAESLDSSVQTLSKAVACTSTQETLLSGFWAELSGGWTQC